MRFYSIYTCVAVFSFLVSAPVRASENEIAVTGSSVAYVQSSYATIDISISTMSKKATEAAQQTAELHSRIVAALQEIPEIEIHTEQYRIAPQWKRDERNQPQKFLGYQARHNLVVRVENIGLVGEIVDMAVQAGAKNVGSIKFHAEVTDSLQKAALGEAVRQAREKAEAVASAAGGQLGELIELATKQAAQAMRREIPSNVSYCRVVAGTRISPGATQVHVVVLGRWKFVEGADQ